MMRRIAAVAAVVATLTACAPHHAAMLPAGIPATCVAASGAAGCARDMARLVTLIESGAPVTTYGNARTVNAGIVVGECGYEMRGTVGPFCGTD